VFICVHLWFQISLKSLDASFAKLRVGVLVPLSRKRHPRPGLGEGRTVGMALREAQLSYLRSSAFICGFNPSFSAPLR
jgi:hypothetical protein